MRRATGSADQYVILYKVSTHARHATGDHCNSSPMPTDQGFNSRPSCDGRHEQLDHIALEESVSTHARHATGDMMALASEAVAEMFQLTPVMRRATHWE